MNINRQENPFLPNPMAITELLKLQGMIDTGDVPTVSYDHFKNSGYQKKMKYVRKTHHGRVKGEKRHG